jgi:hypothetical protein
MTNELMSPRDIAWHNDWMLRVTSIIKKHEEAAQFAASHKRTYVVDTVTSCARLHTAEAHPLMLKHQVYDEFGAIKEIRESVWNAGSRTCPLANEVRVRAAKKQVAARLVRKVESMDNRRIIERIEILPGESWDIDCGRTEEEKLPHTAIQGGRTTDFARGGMYSGGQQAVKQAMKAKAKYDAMPPKEAEKSKAEKIAELERKVAELMGLLKK